MHMCPGQLNIIPEFGTVNGTIVFDGSITPPFGRKLTEPVKLTVQNSRIVKVEGGSDATVFEKWLKDFDDEGMLRMAHMAYGFNPGAQLTGNVVEDERIWGCTEWGIGFVSAEEAPPKGQDCLLYTSRSEIMRIIEELNEEGITVVLITHFMEEAVHADRVIIMNEGEVFLDGSPEKVFSRGEQVRSVNLDVPLAVELAAKLRLKGITVPENIIGMEEMVEYLCQYR